MRNSFKNLRNIFRHSQEDISNLVGIHLHNLKFGEKSSRAEWMGVGFNDGKYTGL